ncbi:UNVERIFIED_CONTAM: AraC family transcriptional regulator, partial [Prevotella sp. 15_C9]
IHRLPAWYETWWAYLFYTLLVMGIIGYSIYAYLKRMKRKNDEKWADSAELVKMHQYLDTKDSISTSEFAEIDKLLLDRATKAVEEHLNEPEFNVVSLAEAMNMSRSTLSRKIKVITGKTPLDFIKDIKMQHAC